MNRAIGDVFLKMFKEFYSNSSRHFANSLWYRLLTAFSDKPRSDAISLSFSSMT